MSGRYVYLGDRLTDPHFIGRPCDPVYRADGRVIVGSGKGTPRNQLVRFADGTEAVVLGRRLRLTSKEVRSSNGPDRRPTVVPDQRAIADPRAGRFGFLAGPRALSTIAAQSEAPDVGC